MTDILLNKVTGRLIEAFISKPSHGLLISGPSGSGRFYLASYIASQLLGINPSDLKSNPYFMIVSPDIDKNQISIEQIRQIKHSMQLKTVGRSKIRRFVLIEQAQLLSHEAQNGLLKLLEEPSQDTVVVLMVDNQSQLLPTVSSRLQKITVHPITLHDTKNYFTDNSEEEVNRAWQLSLGYAGSTYSLLNNQDDHELNSGIVDARELIQMPTFDRLLTISSYSSNKSRLNLMMLALDRILSASHSSAIIKNNTQQMTKILKARKSLSIVQTSIHNNGNTKLNLLYLFTSIG